MTEDDIAEFYTFRNDSLHVIFEGTYIKKLNDFKDEVYSWSFLDFIHKLAGHN